jgi:hypothetical protein
MAENRHMSSLIYLIDQMKLDEIKNLFSVMKKHDKNRKKHPNRGNFFNYVWHG